jgi:hypothetical protein
VHVDSFDNRTSPHTQPSSQPRARTRTALHPNCHCSPIHRQPSTRLRIASNTPVRQKDDRSQARIYPQLPGPPARRRRYPVRGIAEQLAPSTCSCLTTLACSHHAPIAVALHTSAQKRVLDRRTELHGGPRTTDYQFASRAQRSAIPLSTSWRASRYLHIHQFRRAGEIDRCDTSALTAPRQR